MNVLVGVGSRLRGDDAAGSIFAETFSCPGWISIDAGVMPENYFSVIARHTPERVVVIDACSMGLEPGAIRRISFSQIRHSAGFNTHRPPLSFLIERLMSFCTDIVFIGIEPGCSEFGEGISEEVKAALIGLDDVLRKDQINSLAPVG